MFIGESMEGFEEETYSSVFTSLRHPIRRKILRTLSAGPQSFSDLQRTVGIESSHLTYHLEGLTSLLAKTEHGEYALSSLGRIAVSTMKQVEEPPNAPLHTQFLPRFWRRERARVLALGIICIILAVGLVGIFAYHMSAINDKDKAISSLNSRVIALQNQILSANSTIVSLNSQTAELENQLVSNNSIITALQNQIFSANATINSLNSQAAELESQLVLNNSMIAADNSTIFVLQRQITALQNQANSLQTQINELLNKYSVHVIASVPAGGLGSPPTAGAPVYFSVEPIAVNPLINVNVSVNGLEVPSSPSPLGQNFIVEIHLRNATVTNVPAGLAGVYVDFDFANILNYCRPIGFTTMLGQPGGVLVGGMIFGLNGFFDIYGVPVDNASYDQATQYAVAAATNASLGWNNDDGLVAKITFQVTRQPSQALGQSTFNSQLPITYADMVDASLRNPAEIPYNAVQGSLQMDASSP